MQLAANVNADAERWTLDSLPSTQYVQVDDETIEVRAMFPSTTYSLTGETLPPRIRVRRGIAGTTKASHLSGATLTPNYGLGSSGGGGGAIAVDNTVDAPAEVTTIIAPGAVIVGDEATLGKWTLVGAADEDADLSVSVTASGAGEGVARANRDAVGTGGANSYANTVATAEDGDAEARTFVTVTGVQDGLANTTVTAAGGNADVSVAANATGAESGTASANCVADSLASAAEANSSANAQGAFGAASAKNIASTLDGDADASSEAASFGDGDATVNNIADIAGTGLATASVTASRAAAIAGMTALADATSARMAFNGETPIAKPTGVAVTAEGIHAALVSLGLIAA